MDRPSALTKGVSFRELILRIPSTGYGAFGLYRYPAKFIPQVVTYVLETYGRPGMRVIDPFAGSATTGLVARLYGLHYELWDLNPLVEVIHSAALLKEVEVNAKGLAEEIFRGKHEWLPSWPRLGYWHPEKALPLLARTWGFYHLAEPRLKTLLAIPLLRATRQFSYDDEKRQKLSRSPRALKRVAELMEGDWQGRFLQMLEGEIARLVKKLREYQKLIGESAEVEAVVKGGVNALHMQAERPFDLLITSPPYLQAQEYLRRSKLDLLWLGYREEEIRKLARQELPYCDVPQAEIHSETYTKLQEEIEEPHLRKMYDRYFHALIGVLNHLEGKIQSRICLFVGRATIRGKPIPIDRILTEHLTALGWRHEATLIDTIKARTMFQGRTNPATGKEDKRIREERLVVLCKRS